MKAIMISIKPKWVSKILNKEKTIEIRKTCPSIFKHLKSYEGASLDVYIYCTKDKQGLWLSNGKYDLLNENKYIKSSINGKAIAKFTLNKVEVIRKHNILPYYLNEDSVCKKSCLTFVELRNYLNGNVGYAWHISNLVIFDKPKELSEFRKCYRSKGYPQNQSWYLTQAPQSWCYCEEL